MGPTSRAGLDSRLAVTAVDFLTVPKLARAVSSRGQSQACR